MNKRITPKERGLLKGAVRRIFSRSDLRRQAVAASRIEHSDPKRPRVTKWSLCPVCKEPTPTYLMECDHLEPLVPLHLTLEQMSWDDVVDRTWCEPENLVAKCKPCHRAKSKQEMKERAKRKKEAKK